MATIDSVVGKVYADPANAQVLSQLRDLVNGTTFSDADLAAMQAMQKGQPAGTATYAQLRKTLPRLARLSFDTHAVPPATEASIDWSGWQQLVSSGAWAHLIDDLTVAWNQPTSLAAENNLDAMHYGPAFDLCGFICSTIVGAADDVANAVYDVRMALYDYVVNGFKLVAVLAVVVGAGAGCASFFVPVPPVAVAAFILCAAGGLYLGGTTAIVSSASALYDDANKVIARLQTLIPTLENRAVIAVEVLQIEFLLCKTAAGEAYENSPTYEAQLIVTFCGGLLP